MFANIKVIIEFIKIILDVYKFIDNQITEAQFRSNVVTRKKLRDEFIQADKLKQLEILKKLEK
ncbi:MAG: hypothetical protein OEL89_00290 [Candidatus Peregrinibacteria bacterium]|nr:hypothetical protein [Candidatus Peregrinibacteria bacterium]